MKTKPLIRPDHAHYRCADDYAPYLVYGAVVLFVLIMWAVNAIWV